VLRVPKFVRAKQADDTAHAMLFAPVMLQYTSGSTVSL
jgi:hypothetical protein